jgi:hypothetical protein
VFAGPAQQLAGARRVQQDAAAAVSVPALVWHRQTPSDAAGHAQNATSTIKAVEIRYGERAVRNWLPPTTTKRSQPGEYSVCTGRESTN